MGLRSWFARSTLDLFSLLIVLTLFSVATSLIMMVRTLAPSPHQCQRDCSVTFPRHASVDTLADGDTRPRQLRLKLKLGDNLCWYLQVCGFGFFILLQKNIRLCYGRRKRLKISNIARFFYIFCKLYHILFAFINIYGIWYWLTKKVRPYQAFWDHL
jgi:hypothetical protein